MAVEFHAVAAQVVTQLVGESQSQDVQQITFAVSPSGVRFPVRVPLEGFSAAAAEQAAAPYATALAALATHANVAALSVVQDINAANQLEDALHVTVSATNGNLSSQIQVPFRDVLGGGVAGLVEARAAELDQLAGG